jgi:uncharacterized membrane protein
MASVSLKIKNRKVIDDLPGVCMKCGAPSTTTKVMRFRWTPPWVYVLIFGGLLPYVIVASMLTKYQRVETTLCDRHKWYWRMFPVFVGLMFAAIGVLGFVAFILAALLQPHSNRNDELPLSGFICFGTPLTFVAWLIAVMVMSLWRIRPEEISDVHIELSNVAAEFADAVEDQEYRRRRSFDPEEGLPSPGRSRNDDDPRYTR